jgi:hypothetical protein
VQLKAAVAAVVDPAHIADDDRLRFEKWVHQLTLMVNKAEDGPKLKGKAPPAANPQVLASTCAPTAPPSHRAHMHTPDVHLGLCEISRGIAPAHATCRPQPKTGRPSLRRVLSRTSCWAWTIVAPRRTLCHETRTSLQLCCSLRSKHHCRRSHHPLRVKPRVVRMGRCEIPRTVSGIVCRFSATTR